MAAYAGYWQNEQLFKAYRPRASDGSAERSGGANSPATNRGHAAAAIIAALSVESARVGKAI